MKFFTVGTDVLHVHTDCRTTKRGTPPRPADVEDIEKARGLCIVCAPSMTGVLNPIRKEQVWGGKL